jgi:hypothetical protein
MKNMKRRTGQETYAGHFIGTAANEKKVKAATSYDRKSERGIVLVVVLVLSAVALALITALIYMVTAGTQISGFQKRYKTSLEAGKGGTDIFYMLVDRRGDSLDTGNFKTELQNANLNPYILNSLSSTCSGTSLGGTPYTDPLQAKLLTPTSLWSSGCNRSISIDPGDPATYDMKLELGETNKYNYYAKIVDTIEGNTGPGALGGSSTSGLLNSGVVSSGAGEIQVMQKPYLYAMEVVATNSTNTSERSKFSILYQY